MHHHTVFCFEYVSPSQQMREVGSILHSAKYGPISSTFCSYCQNKKFLVFMSHSVEVWKALFIFSRKRWRKIKYTGERSQWRG